MNWRQTDFFGPRSSKPLRELAAVLAAFTALVLLFTWPQARSMNAVPDYGDPLFSIWRLAWVNRQLFADPAHLFDANIFYPERLTFTYSDATIVPALMAAPLLRLGIPRVMAYNVILLSGFVLSGVALFYLVRDLTGRRDAAAVSGLIFALHPYRFEHYSHLELQMTMWMPLALWALHRTFAGGAIRDGLSTGLAFAAQALSSLYYGLYFGVCLAVVGSTLWIARRFPLKPVLALIAGAALAGSIIAPVAAGYLANSRIVGERSLDTVAAYSATGADYLKPQPRSRVYERWSHGGEDERHLFPLVTPVVLGLMGAWPPLSAGQIAYALALAVAVDGSLGTNGMLFPVLRRTVPGFAGLRVPARFSIVAGLSLAILAGYGAARLFTRWPRARAALLAGMLAALAIESASTIALRRVWPQPPGIYAALPRAEDVVLAEFPLPSATDPPWADTRYMYLSTFHWHRLVNGNSGYIPRSYEELRRQEQGFPFPPSVEYLRERGVTHLALHGAFTNPERYRHTAELLDARDDLQLIATAPWEGSESRLYRLRR